jgi:G3E family GTPase
MSRNFAPKSKKLIKKRPAAGSKPRIPLIVVTGYLGAGKTTLLRHLLPALRDRGLKGLLLVNEIGETSIDGALLGDSGFEQRDLLGGCVCCSLQDDLYASILDGIKTYQPQFVLLETSGLSEPESVIDAATSPGLANVVEVTDVVTVVDTPNLELQLKHSMLARRQAEFASSLVLSKLDLADKVVLAKAAAKIAELAPRVPIMHADHGVADPAEVLWRTFRFLDGKGYDEHADCDHDHGVCEVEAHAHHDHDHEDHSDCDHDHGVCHADDHGDHHDHSHDHGHHHHHHHHDHDHLGTHAGHYALNVSLPHEVDRDQLLDALNLLPETAYRVKGFARVKGSARPWIFQRVGAMPPQATAFSLDNVPTPIGMVIIGPRLTADMVNHVIQPIGGTVVATTA